VVVTPDEVTEYGLLMSGGGFHVRNNDDYIERIYPLKEWEANQIRSGAHVYRRRIKVIEDWQEVGK
jgi:hypothetical protein